MATIAESETSLTPGSPENEECIRYTLQTAGETLASKDTRKADPDTKTTAAQNEEPTDPREIDTDSQATVAPNEKPADTEKADQNPQATGTQNEASTDTRKADSYTQATGGQNETLADTGKVDTDTQATVAQNEKQTGLDIQATGTQDEAPTDTGKTDPDTQTTKAQNDKPTNPGKVDTDTKASAAQNGKSADTEKVDPDTHATGTQNEVPTDTGTTDLVTQTTKAQNEKPTDPVYTSLCSKGLMLPKEQQEADNPTGSEKQASQDTGPQLEAIEQDKTMNREKMKNVTDILCEVKSLILCTGEGYEQQIKHIQQRLFEVLDTASSPQNIEPGENVSSELLVKQCERFLSEAKTVVCNREQLPPCKVLMNASEGLALKGIFQGGTTEPKKIILNPPNVTLKKPEIAPVDITEEYTTKEQLDKFIKTLDTMSYSVAVNAKVGLSGYRGQVSRSREGDQEYQSMSSMSQEECKSLSQIRYTVVPTATCELNQKELTLSQECLSEIQKLEKRIRECDAMDDVCRICEKLFDTFGTHVNVGPLHFGGIRKTVATYSSETLSPVSSVRTLLNRALNKHVFAESTGVTINSEGGSDHYKVEIAQSRTGGPQEVSNISLWKSGLNNDNSTWTLIEWGNRLVGIWDLLHNHKAKLTEFRTLPSTMENVWQKLTGTVSDAVFQTKELMNMIERWLSDDLFLTKCNNYLKTIVETFHRVERDTEGLAYWWNTHCIGGPLDKFLARLVSVSSELPKGSLSKMRQFVYELVEVSPSHSFFRNINIIGWAREFMEVLTELGLDQLYPNQISLQKATEIRTCLDSLESKELPWKLIHMLMRLDHQARDHFLSELKTQKADDSGFKFDYGEYQIQNVEECNLPLHPLDVMLATFTCCDGILKQVFTQNLFLCKLAIPLLYPVCSTDNLVLSLWALRGIVVQCSDGSEGTFETAVTDQPFSVVTFVRLGSPSISKSKLMNDVLTDGSHQTFHSSECQTNSKNRKIANGVLECSWFLPAFKGTDIFPNVTLFVNLRGDASTYQKQMSFVRKVSSLVVVMADVTDIAEPPHIDTFAKICSLSNKNIIQVLTSESKCPDKKTVETVLNKLVTRIGKDTLQRIKQIISFGKHPNSIDLKIKLQKVIPDLLEGAFTVSLENAAELCQNDGVQVDEHSSMCFEGKRLANCVMQMVKGKDIVECKRDLLPLQGQTWQEYSNLLKQQHRTAGKAKSSVSQHDLKRKMISLRKKQVEMCNNLTPFISLFLSAIQDTDSEGVRTFFLQWMKLSLDKISRLHLPRLLNDYCILWGEYRKAKHKPLLPNDSKTESLQKAVDRAEQDVAEASFGLEHIFRELGQIYEAYQENSSGVSKNIGKAIKQLPETAAKLLLTGTPLELLDGDASNVPIIWVRAVLSKLQTIIGEEKVFVISVMGVQSSGKSTLLNTMFGLQFPVSAGRCTRGAFMQLIKVARSDLPVRFIAVIDTEGLRAPELAMLKHTHDNELGTLAVGLGDITLINNKGENTAEIKDVLQIVVHAFMRMKVVNKKLDINRACIFIHQNVPAINAKVKMLQASQKLQDQLDYLTQEAAKSENRLDIKSFSQIIQFDIDENVVYFMDLWQGNPPMGPVNREYCANATTVKQQLFKMVLNSHKTFLTVSDLALRIQDFWNGILADDFVFSFRNSLELKAYRSMEDTYFGYQWELENCITTWIQQTAEIKLKKCESENDLELALRILLQNLNMVVSTEKERVERLLMKFFDESYLQDMVIQWRQRKLNDLSFDSDQYYRQFEKHLIEMKNDLSIELLSRNESKELEKKVIKNARLLADELRSIEGTLEAESGGRFDLMWQDVLAEYPKLQSHSPRWGKFDEIMHVVLEDVFQSDRLILADKLKEQPLLQPLEEDSLTKSISIHDVGEEHLSFETETTAKTEKVGKFKKLTGTMTGIVGGLKKMVSGGGHTLKQKARSVTFSNVETILADIDQDLLHLCHKDTKFQKAYAYDVIRKVKHGIDHFNKTEANQMKFSVLQTFTVKLAVHVSRHCVTIFTKMHNEYEQAHGSDTKRKAIRDRALKVFNHTMKQSAEEIIVAELFCDQLKDIVENTLASTISHRVVTEILSKCALTKFHLISNILDQLAGEEEFDKFCEYIRKPRLHALGYITEYTNRHMFTRQGKSPSRYSELMTQQLDRIVECVKKSANHATKTVEEVPENKLHKWVEAFCGMADEIPVKPSDLNDFRGNNIEHFSHLQEKFLLQVEAMRRTLVKLYSGETKETIKWKGTTPYQQIIERTWGCSAKCPFCYEPCSITDPNHYPQEAHRCLQHRPRGISGTIWTEGSPLGGELIVDTCSFGVQSRARFPCLTHGEENNACSRSDRKPTHPYKEYKHIFPEWDIAPDPLNATSKYWAWFMKTFQQQLADRYQVKLPSIPPDWLSITKKGALEDLRKLH